MNEKFIFFPKKGPPQVVIITGSWTMDKIVELAGSASEKDVEEGRYQFYPAGRCQPFSNELWNACLEWMEKRDLLKAEYEQLMKKGVSKVDSDELCVCGHPEHWHNIVVPKIGCNYSDGRNTCLCTEFQKRTTP